MAMVILVLVYFVWVRKIKPVFATESVTEKSTEETLKVNSEGNLESFEDQKLIAMDAYKMFFGKDEVTLVVDGQDSKEVSEVKNVFAELKVEVQVLEARGQVLNSELTKQLVRDTKSDHFPKICIGQEKIIDLNTLLRLLQNGHLYKALDQAGIVYRKPDERNLRESLGKSSIQASSADE